MSVNSSSSRVAGSEHTIHDSPAEAMTDTAAGIVGVPQMKSVEKTVNPFGYIPSDLMYRLFEELIDFKTPHASVFRLSETCKYFRVAVNDFMANQASGQQLRTRLKLFEPRQPFSALFIKNRSEQLNNNIRVHCLFEAFHAASFRSDKKVRAITVAKNLTRHINQRLTTPFRLVWPAEGGWWIPPLQAALHACHSTVLNIVFNDTLHSVLVQEMFPALSACPPGSSVFLELRRTELDEQLLSALGKLCHEHSVIYQISLQSWKPDDSQALCRFLSGLMQLPNAVQVIDMSYGTPITDDVAAAITQAIPGLTRPIELRFPTQHLSESSMEALIRAAVKKNACGLMFCRLKLYVGEDMYSPKKPVPDGLYLDVETKASLKARGVRFSKLRGCAEGKDPAFLFWL